MTSTECDRGHVPCQCCSSPATSNNRIVTEKTRPAGTADVRGPIASCTPLRPPDGEGRTEPLERLLRVPGGPALQGHDAAVAEAVQCGGDGRVVDLATPGLATAGYVGDLDLADQRQRPLDQGNQVPLADLGVVEVQVEPQVRVPHGLDQGDRVGRAGER